MFNSNKADKKNVKSTKKEFSRQKEQVKATITDENGFVRIDPRFLSNI